MEKTKVLVLKNDDLELPKYESERASGMDVRTNLSLNSLDELQNRLGDRFVVNELEDSRNVVLKANGGRYLFPTGILVAIPTGHEIQVRPRSGLAVKKGVTVLNTPGTVDSDYRGEIGVILVNTSNEPVMINDGDRIAQLVLAKVEQLQWTTVAKLPNTKRGIGGFNSTGTK